MPAASAAPGGLKSGLGICRNAGSPLPSPYVSPGKYLLDMILGLEYVKNTQQNIHRDYLGMWDYGGFNFYYFHISVLSISYGKHVLL